MMNQEDREVASMIVLVAVMFAIWGIVGLVWGVL